MAGKSESFILTFYFEGDQEEASARLQACEPELARLASWRLPSGQAGEQRIIGAGTRGPVVRLIKGLGFRLHSVHTYCSSSGGYRLRYK